MGKFFNPDNSAFQTAINSQIYIDKTGLIAFTNSVLGTQQAFICNSRPRRFGKSITANMLTAYYSKGCRSDKLFANLSIAKDAAYPEHLNKYDVIHFDVQWCLMMAGAVEKTVEFISENVLKELRDVYGAVISADTHNVAVALSDINTATGSRFVIIIDEWDVLIRDEAANKIVRKSILTFCAAYLKGQSRPDILL